MIANYHTHTYMCGHAQIRPRAYVERAIKGGIKIMGFSDHIPFMFPDGFESGHRVKMKNVPKYFEKLGRLRDEYADKIEIHIGFEAEYYPLYFEKMLSNAVQWGAEYLILGQHFVGNEHPGGKYCGSRGGGSEEQLIEYADCVIAGMKTGKFTYVAHPDVFNFLGGDEVYEREMRRICVCSKETGVPLEINFLGIRDNRHYPRELFWKIAGEEGCTVVFGLDAHRAVDCWDNKSEQIALETVKKYGLKLAETVELVPLK